MFQFVYGEYSFQLSTLTDAILFAKVGILSPSIISSNELFGQLKHIKDLLLSDVKLPHIENGLMLLDLINLNVYLQNGKLVYVIEIPLVSNDMYQIYNIVPFPMRLNETYYVYINPSFKQLIINIDKTKYIPILENDNTKCKSINESFILCDHVQPLYTTNYCQICEIELLLQSRSIPSTCDQRLIRLSHNIFHPFHNKNAWLYTVLREQLIIVKCNNEQRAKEHVVLGSGILMLLDNCKAITPQVTMISKKHYMSNLSLDFMPSFNIIHHCCSDLNNNLSNLKLQSGHLKNFFDLNKVSTEIKNLKEMSQEARFSDTRSFNMHNIFTYILLTFIILLFICYKFITTFILSKRNTNVIVENAENNPIVLI